MACPNYNSPEWKLLEDSLGSRMEALTVYSFANYNKETDIIPTPEEAQKLLRSSMQIDADERQVRNSDAYNLGKMQREVSETLQPLIEHENTTPGQIATLEKIVANNQSYQELLSDNLRRFEEGSLTNQTISVTNFIGSSDYTGGEVATNEDFKLFGTYLHKLLEDTQREANAQRKSSKEILTREYFDKHRAEMRKKEKFEIESLDEDTLFKIAEGMAGLLQKDSKSRSLIIPEVTVMTKDTFDRVIVGRIDLLIIDTDGNVRIFDFKTKKVDNLLDKSGHIQVDKVRESLAGKRYTIDAGAASSFQQDKRGIYDTWTLQTKTYENMLWKMGVSVSGSEIVSLIYQTTDNKASKKATFQGYALEVFQGSNYYTGSGKKVRAYYNGKKLTPEQSQARVDDLRNRVDELLPLTEAQAAVSKANLTKHFAFDMSQQEEESLVQKLGERVEAEMARTRTGLRTHKKGTALNTVYQQRLQTLLAFKDVLKTASLGQSLKMKFTCEALESEFTLLANESNKAYLAWRNSSGKDQVEAGEVIRQAYNKMVEMLPVFQLVETVVATTISKGTSSDITADSPIARLMADLRVNISDVTETFRETALEQFVTVIQNQIGQKGFERVSEQYRQAIEPKIALYEADIEKLKQGLSPSLSTRLGNNFFKLASKLAPKSILQDATAIEKSQAEKIEELKLKIEQLRLIQKTGLSYEREDIKKYIRGISDPESMFYIGQSDAYSTGFITRMDGFMASISNSDQALYSLVSFLKQAQHDAIAEAQAEHQANDFDKYLDELVKDRGEKQANLSVTEERVVVTRSKANGWEPVSNIQKYFIKPTSAEYDQVSRDYNDDSRKVQEDLNDAEDAVKNTEKGSPENQAARDEVARLVKYRTEIRQKFRDFQMQHQHQPMKPEYYQLMARLDPDTEARVQELYMDIELLQKKKGGKNSEELFDPEDLHTIHQLEIEIRQLRQDAASKNPVDQELLDKLNDFFTYETNWVAFNRTKLAKERAYADDQETLNKWYLENMVYAPTEDWHKELDTLWKELADIAGEMDPILKELIQERSKILRPYRRDGELNPTYLSLEDIKTLEEVEERMQAYRDVLKTREDSRTAEMKEKTSGIMARINQLSTKRINEFYVREMEERTEQLIKGRQAVIAAETRSNTARISGNQTVWDAAKLEEIAIGNQYQKTLQEYKAWYDKHHTNKFSPLKFTKTGLSPKGEAKPKKFNYDNRPPKEMEAEYMELRPRGKWNQRVIKDEAKNPDYEQHYRLPDGTPLPKSMRIDNGIVSVIPGTDTQYVNPAYTKLQSDSKAAAFYNQMMPYYFKRQDSITGRAPGYLVPGGESNTVQESANNSLTGALNKTAKGFTDEYLSGKESEIDYATNFYGDAGDRVRLRLNEPLSNNLQSSDSINNLIKWSAESHYNENLSRAQPVADSMIDYLRLELSQLTQQKGSIPGYEKRVADLTQLIKLMTFERDKFVTGKSSDGDNRKTRKILGQVFSYTAFSRIAFDMANQTKNYVSGSLQAWMAAGGDNTSLNYSRADMGWALSQQFGQRGFFADYLKDWGKISGLTLNTQLYRLYDPGQYGLDKALDDTTGTKGRRFLAKIASPIELSHALQEKGDMMISQATWLAVMNHHKYRKLDGAGNPIITGQDEEGNNLFEWVPAHQCYELDKKNNIIHIKDDVEFTREDERFLREIVHSEVRKAQGNYATNDKTERESTMMGQVMNFFRKYLVSNVLTRLGHIRPNWEGKELHYGYLRAVGAAFKYYGGLETAKHLLLSGYTPQFVKNSKMNTFYSEKVGHASRDLIAATVLSVIAMMLMAYVRKKDEDDEEIGFFAGNVIRVLWGVKQETVSMNPMPIVGGADDYIKNFTSFTTMTNELTKVPKILTHLLATMYANTVGGWGEEPEDDEALYHVAYTSAYYQRAEGAYEAGDYKLEKDFADLTGIKNIRNFFMPQYGIDTAKKYQ